MTSGNNDDDTVKKRASNIDNSVITGTLKADKGGIGGKHNLGLPVYQPFLILQLP